MRWVTVECDKAEARATRDCAGNSPKTDEAVESCPLRKNRAKMGHPQRNPSEADWFLLLNYGSGAVFPYAFGKSGLVKVNESSVLKMKFDGPLLKSKTVGCVAAHFSKSARSGAPPA